MAQIDLSQFAVGGAHRPDSFTGLDPQFLNALQSMVAGAPPEIQNTLRITSGYRSPEKQAELWEGALAKYGSPEVARKWVAPPGKSHHNKGGAVDLKYLDDAARAWAHENANQFGLHFPLSNEDWHVEMMGSRGGPTAQLSPAPQGAPQMPAMSAGAPPEPARSPVAQMLSSMAPVAQPQAAPTPAQPRPMASDPAGASMNAAAGSQAAGQLQSALMPDIERLMGLSKRPSLG